MQHNTTKVIYKFKTRYTFYFIIENTFSVDIPHWAIPQINTYHKFTIIAINNEHCAYAES